MSYEEFATICIICARSGSKGIPSKNIKIIHGKPLIAWTIEVAKQCDFISKVIVSTDGEEIAEIALKYGAEVPIMRPAELANSTISKMPALQHMITFLENNNEKVDIVVDLDPTNPLRTIDDIWNAFNELVSSNADSVFSIFKTHHNPYWTMFERHGKYLSVVKDPGKTITCRQQLPDVFAISGNVVVAWRDTIMKKETYFTDKMKGVLIPKERAIDIDSQLEFDICEMLLRRKLNEGLSIA